jgi:hypothetical protein
MGFFVQDTVRTVKKRIEAAELNFLASNPIVIFTPGFYPKSIAATLEIFDSTVIFDYSGNQLILSQQNTLMQCDPAASFPTGNYVFEFVTPAVGLFPTNVIASNQIVLASTADSATVGDGYGIFTYLYSF